MYKQVKPKEPAYPHEKINKFPHCDPRILHAPGECRFCDLYPLWQSLRNAWNIAFTGYTPEGLELPCPADNARGDKHKQWGGNLASQPPNKSTVYGTSQVT